MDGISTTYCLNLIYQFFYHVVHFELNLYTYIPAQHLYL